MDGPIIYFGTTVDVLMDPYSPLAHTYVDGPMNDNTEVSLLMTPKGRNTFELVYAHFLGSVTHSILLTLNTARNSKWHLFRPSELTRIMHFFLS